MSTWIIDNLGHLLTSASILIAFTTWFVNQKNSTRSEKIIHTASYLCEPYIKQYRQEQGRNEIYAKLEKISEQCEY